MLVAARHSKLEESIKLHQYIHESDDVLSWITEKQQTAASDEFGKDFEHLLVSVISILVVSLDWLCPRFCRRSSMSSNEMFKPVQTDIALQ